jgi:hypothetical protein
MLKRLPIPKIRLLALAIIASLVLQAPTYYFPMFLKNWPPPLYSTSYYIQDADPAKMWELGCLLGTRDATTSGKQDNLVILAFGKMWQFENSQKVQTIGVRTYTNPYTGQRQNLSIYDLEARAQNFAVGYWVCSANDKGSQLTLGIGTNSFDFFGQTNLDPNNLRGMMADFGRNWAYMINRLNAWGAATGYNRQVLFTGAIDIEWAGRDPADHLFYWHSPYVVRGWVDAFDQWDNGTSIFFNYGACVGCPTISNPSWFFDGDLPWSQDQVWYVSWGSQPAFAVPEIYSNNGVLARQWAAVSKNATNSGKSRIVFSGAMTQMQACQQRRSSDSLCDILDNTPAEGWGQLVDAVNADAFTEQPLPQYSTDIRWQFK